MTRKQTIVVTGAASGLGQAAMRAMAEAGYPIAAVDRSQVDPEDLPAGCQSYICDVTDADAVDATIAGIGPVSGLVNCAGIVQGAKLASGKGAHDTDIFARVLAVNLFGTFNMMRSTAQAMLANEPDEIGQRGVIVTTASIAAYDGQIGQLAYAASKGAVASMTLPAARDMAKSGIRVMSIAPGIFDTPMLAGLPGEVRSSLEATVPFPAKLANPADFGALARHIFENPTLNGEVIRLDGALRMAPQ